MIGYSKGKRRARPRSTAPARPTTLPPNDRPPGVPGAAIRRVPWAAVSDFPWPFPARPVCLSPEHRHDAEMAKSEGRGDGAVARDGHLASARFWRAVGMTRPAGEG